MESLVSLSWCIRQGTRGEGDGDADYLPPCRLCTFNCRSLKNSLFDVQQLCKNFDIIFLQEHWLLPFELDMLSNIDNGFLAFGVSAVDISAGVVRGRPYGGTAVLYRKQLAKVIDIVDCDEPRLCAVNIKTCNGPVLFVNVYMPTDARDDNSFDTIR